MVKFKVWTTDMPEPEPDEIVSAESMDCSWRLPWKTVREDAISGFTTVFIEEKPDAKG
jgi:hypothetical protein